jgi:hypothetical protein
VDVSPSAARVTLDRAPLPGLPFAGSFRSTSDTHVLEASAEGFETERQLVVFDHDQAIKLELRAVAAPARVHARRSVATTASAATLPVSNAPRTAVPQTEDAEPGAELKARPRQRAFDMKDPYAD